MYVRLLEVKRAELAFDAFLDVAWAWTLFVQHVHCTEQRKYMHRENSNVLIWRITKIGRIQELWHCKFLELPWAANSFVVKEAEIVCYFWEN